MKNCVAKQNILLDKKTNNSDVYDGKYIKIKFNSNDDLPPNKTRNNSC